MDTPIYELPSSDGSGWQPRAYEPVNPDLPLIPSGRRAARQAEQDAQDVQDAQAASVNLMLAQIQGARMPAAPLPEAEAPAAPEAPVAAPAPQAAWPVQVEFAPQPQSAPAAPPVPVAPVPQAAPVPPVAAPVPTEEPADVVTQWLASAPMAAPATVSAPAAAPAMTPAPVAAPAMTAAPVAAPAMTAAQESVDDLVTHALTEVERRALERADRELIACLHEVVAQNASDLHVTASAAPMIRVDGGLRPALSDAPWSREQVARALYTLLTDEQRQQFEEKLELDFAYTISANARFRVNFYQQRGALGAAFRLIPTEIKTLTQLGVPEIIGEFAKLPRGLVLVTGPTGSGKSTTLAALIDLANSTRRDHIVTVEDPIEFLHRHKSCLVNQREVGSDTHSFANALKHVLRQDPDIILIGELRDLETIQVALTSAETGHLVFATLHTQDAPQTIDRVIDVFPPHQQGQVRAQLAATLRGVVCQALVKRASGRGRVVATEIMMTTPAIANLIREGKTYQIASMMQAGGDSGMHTMDQHLADLVSAGTVTREAAEEKVHDLDGFDRLVTRQGSPTDASRGPAAPGPDFGDSFSSFSAMGR